MPQQDSESANCRHLEPQNETSFKQFVTSVREVALCHGQVASPGPSAGPCPRCGDAVSSVGVVAARLSVSDLFHPACFTCTVCHELLVDLHYCLLAGQLYCLRHYAEKLKPRCCVCDELIFSGQYTKALNKVIAMYPNCHVGTNTSQVTTYLDLKGV